VPGLKLKLPSFIELQKYNINNKTYINTHDRNDFNIYITKERETNIYASNFLINLPVNMEDSILHEFQENYNYQNQQNSNHPYIKERKL